MSRSGYAVYYRNPATRQFERIEGIQYSPHARYYARDPSFIFTRNWKILQRIRKNYSFNVYEVAKLDDREAMFIVRTEEGEK